MLLQLRQFQRFIAQAHPQIDANAKFQERARKAQAQRAARPNPAPAAGAAADAAVNADGNAGDAPAPPAAPVLAPAMPAAPALAAVSPPEQWGDQHMFWRHSLTFVFVLNGPFTFWHPQAGSRVVCEFLKKAPRNGPQEGQRAVASNDNRRAQRGGQRDEARSESAALNSDFLQNLRASREAQASAADQANDLMRIQLQIQLAQHSATSVSSNLSHMHSALKILGDLPLNAEQVAKKQKMEKDLAEACLAVGSAPAHNPLAAIAVSLSTFSRPPSAAQLASPAAAGTIPRPALAQPARAAGAGGGARHLHPAFIAAQDAALGPAAPAVLRNEDEE